MQEDRRRVAEKETREEDVNRDTIHSLHLAALQLSEDLMQWMLNEGEGRIEHADKFRERAVTTATQIADALKGEG